METLVHTNVWLQTRRLHATIDELSTKMIKDVEDEHCVEMARLATRRNMISDRTSAFSAQLHSANQVKLNYTDSVICHHLHNKSIIYGNLSLYQ